MARTSWRIYLGLILIIGGLVLFAWTVIRAQSIGKPTATPRQLFASDSILYIETSDDFPIEPKALHPTRLQINDQTLETPDLSLAHDISARTTGLYYFDERKKLVVEAGVQDLEFTRVDNSDLSGYFLASLPGKKIVWSRGDFSNGETRAQLLIATVAEPTNRVIHTQTLVGQQTFVPLAWSSDDQTLWYGQFDLDKQAAGVKTYSKIFQVKVDGVPDDQGLSDRELAFPAKHLRAIGLDPNNGRAFFVSSDDEDTAVTEGPALFVLDLLTEDVKTISLPEGFPLVSSFAASEEFVALNVRSGDQKNDKIFWVNLTSGLTHSLAETQERQTVVGFLNGDLLLSRGGPERGTFRISLGGGVESRVHDWRAVAIVGQKIFN